MNKSQSAGYIILGTVIALFTATVLFNSPTTETKELTYSNFLERLSNKEFSKIEKADEYLIAIPKDQPKQEKTSEKQIPQSPFLQLEKQVPTVQYKVLTPYDPDIMKKLEASEAEIAVKKPSESSQLLGILGSMFLPLVFIILLIPNFLDISYDIEEVPTPDTPPIRMIKGASVFLIFLQFK